jgi:acetyl-CoA C-acetyltransferase
MTDPLIIGAKRSPVAPVGGPLSHLETHDLAAPVLRALLSEAGLTTREVGEVIVSNAIGLGGNPARLVALASGLPEAVGGLSIDRQCAGGLDAVLLAGALVRAGVHEVVIAGGVESASLRPQRLRTFVDGRPAQPYDQAPFSPWPARDPDMGKAAHRLAREWDIPKDLQDAWAIESHAKARASIAPGIVPMGELSTDPFTRRLTPALCARAPSISGPITAANMAVSADGAGLVLVVSDQVAQRLGRPALRLVSGASLGGDPERPGLAPIAAIEAVLGEAGLTPDDITMAEIMEAFAVQAIACQRGAGLDPAVVNPIGGALARGHPIGASGAILAVNLYHQLCEQGGTGLAAIAAAGGLGTALVLTPA